MAVKVFHPCLFPGLPDGRVGCLAAQVKMIALGALALQPGGGGPGMPFGAELFDALLLRQRHILPVQREAL